MLFRDFCMQNLLIRHLWSLLPSRCQYPGCEDRYLRWTEHRLEALSKERELLEWYHICTDCVQKLRNHAFQNGWERVEKLDGNLSFRTYESEAEGP